MLTISTKNNEAIMHEHFRQDNRLLRVQFGCCLSAVLELNKHDYPENSRVVFCPNKQRSFGPFKCLDHVTVIR